MKGAYIQRRGFLPTRSWFENWLVFKRTQRLAWYSRQNHDGNQVSNLCNTRLIHSWRNVLLSLSLTKLTGHVVSLIEPYNPGGSCLAKVQGSSPPSQAPEGSQTRQANKARKARKWGKATKSFHFHFISFHSPWQDAYGTFYVTIHHMPTNFCRFSATPTSKLCEVV